MGGKNHNGTMPMDLPPAARWPEIGTIFYGDDFGAVEGMSTRTVLTDDLIEEEQIFPREEK